MLQKVLLRLPFLLMLEPISSNGKIRLGIGRAGNVIGGGDWALTE